MNSAQEQAGRALLTIRIFHAATLERVVLPAARKYTTDKVLFAIRLRESRKSEIIFFLRRIKMSSAG